MWLESFAVVYLACFFLFNTPFPKLELHEHIPSCNLVICLWVVHTTLTRNRGHLIMQRYLCSYVVTSFSCQIQNLFRFWLQGFLCKFIQVNVSLCNIIKLAYNIVDCRSISWCNHVLSLHNRVGLKDAGARVTVAVWFGWNISYVWLVTLWHSQVRKHSATPELYTHPLTPGAHEFCHWEREWKEYLVPSMLTHLFCSLNEIILYFPKNETCYVHGRETHGHRTFRDSH